MSRRLLVIAHRGACAERPEHTLESYALAIAQGADFIEPDLVATRDGHLIARHENALAMLRDDGSVDDVSTSTDVASRPTFADRLTTKVVDGVTVRGWFSEDFLLDEIRQLRALERLQRLRPANRAYDGLFRIPTFQEIIALAKEASAATGRPIGVYPETKHPSWFEREGHFLDGRPIGIDLTRRMLEILLENDFTDPARLFLQSFECSNLQRLRKELMPAAGVALPLIQLLDDEGAPWDLRRAGDVRSYGDLAEPSGLAFVAGYANGVGVAKAMILDEYGIDTGLVRNAHAAGLAVHAWTFRPENHFLPPRFRRGADAIAHGDLAGELRAHLEAGVDGVFIDSPGVFR